MVGKLKRTGRIFLLLMPLNTVFITTAFCERTPTTMDFINDEGKVYRGNYSTGQFYPLAARRWYQTSQGAATSIFVNIADTSLGNGFCNRGTAFRKYKSGHTLLKCFDHNNTGTMKVMLLKETKSKHLITVGNCVNDKFSPHTIELCKDVLFRKPEFYNRQGDVGDAISQEECVVLYADGTKYNWDHICQ